jgi:hypothetical protein
VFRQLFRRLRLRYTTTAWASGGPAGGGILAEEEQQGRYAAEKTKYYRYFMCSGQMSLAALRFRRVRVAGRSAVGRGFAVALTHSSADFFRIA